MFPEKLRVVLDTGVLVSGLLAPQSVPGRAINFAIQKTALLVSTETVAELVDVLGRDKFASYTDREQIRAFLHRLLDIVAFIPVVSNRKACRDPSDDKFLSLAADGQADCIVTGDNDLLILNPFEGIAIITPREFLIRYRREGEA